MRRHPIIALVLTLCAYVSLCIAASWLCYRPVPMPKGIGTTEDCYERAHHHRIDPGVLGCPGATP